MLLRYLIEINMVKLLFVDFDFDVDFLLLIDV